MKVEFDTKLLMETIKTISMIFSRSAMSSTAGNDCLITATQEGKVFVESANQGLYVKQELPGTVDEHGKVVLNTIYLSSLRLNGKTSTLNYRDGDGRISFKSGRFKGELSASQDVVRVEQQRPTEVISNWYGVPTELFTSGIGLISFQPTATQDPQLNVRLQLRGNSLALSANDPYRAVLFKGTIKESFDTEFDSIMPNGFISAALGRANSAVVQIGIDDEAKVFCIKGKDIEVWHPIKQATVAEVEDYVQQLRETPAKAAISFPVERGIESIAVASSIVTNVNGTDVKMEFKVVRDQKVAHCLVESANGSGDHELDLDTVTADEESVSAHISSRQTLEFLNLIRQGKVHMQIWEDQTMIRCDDRDATYIMPQVTA